MNKETVELINDLKFKLKTRDPDDAIADELNSYLDNIINAWVLDQDPHSLASIPQDLPPKIGNADYKDLAAWNQSVLQWVPYEPISYIKLLIRCMHNSEGEVSHYLFRSAFLSLKEEGEITISNDGMIARVRK